MSRLIGFRVLPVRAHGIASIITNAVDLGSPSRTECNPGRWDYTVLVTQVCKIVEAGNHVVYQCGVVPAPTAKGIKVSGESVWSSAKYSWFLYKKDQQWNDKKYG